MIVADLAGHNRALSSAMRRLLKLKVAPKRCPQLPIQSPSCARHGPLLFAKERGR
ncbi:hypothetical protein APY04_0607 [Hyphomicrobium sulfonivorans]|uniref:Uncharacterized protein n=1 Tax=Hyphomicrobium sulfonivorans TaxID=121290 RepID=A0A120CXH3_HYPSL|nr:hypothetical protein APY04_0607 [Hyphomicrobium sulfonivorans]